MISLELSAWSGIGHRGPKKKTEFIIRIIKKIKLNAI